MKSSLFLGSAFTSIVLADVCNRDNVLRCLVASSADQKCHRHSSDFNLNSYLTHFDYCLNHPARLLTTTTTTAIAPAATTTCTDVFGGSHKYTRYYKGSGFTENHNNPGNPGDNSSSPPVTVNYPATQDICTAATNCASYAITLPETCYSYDLHFLTSQNQWECVLFYDATNNAGYFNVPNSDVAVGVGYYINS
jgi:hypothetical protein